MIPLDPQVVHRLGWALVHFVWQGAALAAVTALALALLRRRSAALRYVVACAGLAAMLAAPCVTIGLVPQAPSVPSPVTLEGRPALGTMGDSVWVARVAEASAAAPAPSGPPWPSRLAAVLEAAFLRVVVGWLIGVGAFSFWYMGGWLRVRRLAWRRATQAMEPWGRMAADLARRMRVSRPVRFLESAAVRVPTLIGWLRPVVLLPASVLTGMAPGEIEALLAHELAHVRRWDYLANLLQTAAETLLFYHPAVWWLSRRIRVEREQCCDDMVVATCGDRVAYARALAALEESRAIPVPALAARGGQLLARIRRILAMESERRSSAGWLVGSAALAAIALASAAVLAAGSGLCAAGGAGAAAPSGEATQSASAGGEAIRFVTPGGDAVKFVTPSGEEIRMLGVTMPAPKALNGLASGAQDPLAAYKRLAVGGKHILIEARLIQVPAEAKEKMEAGLAKVSPDATSGPALLTEEQAKAFLAHADTIKSVKTLATPKVMVAENQEARVFVGEHRPLSLPLVEVGAPLADKTGIRTTIIFPVGAGVSVMAALSPDGQSIALKAEPCISQLEEKGGKTVLTEARDEVQTAVPPGQWLLLRAPQKSYRLTAISQKDDPVSGTISMEVLREPLPDAGRAAGSIWVLLKPSLAQAAGAAADTANAEAAKASAAAAEADAVGKANDLKRYQELFAANLISQQQLDAARTAALVAAVDREAAYKQVEAAMAALGHKSLSEEDQERLEETNRLLDNDLDVIFSEVSLAEVLQYLREVGRLNIIVSPDLPKAVLANPRVSMDVKRVATKYILRIALVGSGLDYEVGPGYVLILARRTPEQADVFRNRDGLISIPQPPGEKTGEREVRVFELRYAKSDAVARIVAQTYPDDSTKVVSDARANRLIAVASPERFKQIEALIEQIDQAANEAPKQGQVVPGVAPPPEPAARGAPAAGAPWAGEPEARNAAQTVQSMQNVKTLGRAAHWFASDHENRFPEANWPEALRPAPGFTEGILLDPASPASGRAYAINVKVAGRRLSAIRRPDRTVLFFECAFESPRGGGPESLPPQPRRPGGYVIGFCDGHVERILKKDLGQLLWDPGADADRAKPE